MRREAAKAADANERHARALKCAEELRDKVDAVEAELQEQRSSQRSGETARSAPRAPLCTALSKAELDAEQRFGSGRAVQRAVTMAGAWSEERIAAGDSAALRSRRVRDTTDSQGTFVAAAVGSSGTSESERGVEQQQQQQQQHIAVHQLETRLRQCFGELRALREQLENSEGARDGMARKCVTLRTAVAQYRAQCGSSEAQRVSEAQAMQADMRDVRASYKRQTLEMMAQIDALRAEIDAARALGEEEARAASGV